MKVDLFVMVFPFQCANFLTTLLRSLLLNIFHRTILIAPKRMTKMEFLLKITLLRKFWTVHIRLETFKQSRICALISHLRNERIFSSSFLSLMFFSTTSSRRLLTRKYTSKLIHLLHLTVLVLTQFLILTRQLSRRNLRG